MECIVARNQKDYEAGITKIFLPEDYIRIYGAGRIEELGIFDNVFML